MRFPGSFGSSYLYYVVPKVILFRTEHSPRTLVRKVDFISAPGTNKGNVYRPGGPIALVTNRCLFSFADGHFMLTSVHPGHTVEEVSENTGFEFDGRPQCRNAGALARDTQAAARGGGAATGGGLSAIRRAGVRRRQGCFRGLKNPALPVTTSRELGCRPRGRPAAGIIRNVKEMLGENG